MSFTSPFGRPNASNVSSAVGRSQALSSGGVNNQFAKPQQQNAFTMGTVNRGGTNTISHRNSAQSGAGGTSPFNPQPSNLFAMQN